MGLKDFGDDRRYYFDFKWEGKEFVIDNMDMFIKKEVFWKLFKVILFVNSFGDGMSLKVLRVGLLFGWI